MHDDMHDDMHEDMHDDMHADMHDDSRVITTPVSLQIEFKATLSVRLLTTKNLNLSG